jgi:hypothetical protein
LPSAIAETLLEISEMESSAWSSALYVFCTHTSQTPFDGLKDMSFPRAPAKSGAGKALHAMPTILSHEWRQDPHLRIGPPPTEEVDLSMNESSHRTSAAGPEISVSLPVLSLILEAHPFSDTLDTMHLMHSALPASGTFLQSWQSMLRTSPSIFAPATLFFLFFFFFPRSMPVLPVVRGIKMGNYN